MITETVNTKKTMLREHENYTSCRKTDMYLYYICQNNNFFNRNYRQELHNFK